MMQAILLFFISFRWLDAFDIIIVSLAIFQLYRLVKGTVAINIFVGILLVYLLWLIVKALNLQLLETILGQFIGVGVIALIVVFQQEIRRFLLILGTSDFLKKFNFSLFKSNTNQKKIHPLDINTLAKACKNMSESKTGAIIVITNNSELNFYVNTGDVLNAKVNLRLIESIFFKNNPLHDGAIIISDNYIKAARCVLPVTEKEDFPAHLGMRHRAAVGITENSDAVAIVVSEQTGAITYAKNGELMMDISIPQLSKKLEEDFN